MESETPKAAKKPSKPRKPRKKSAKSGSTDENLPDNPGKVPGQEYQRNTGPYQQPYRDFSGVKNDEQYNTNGPPYNNEMYQQNPNYGYQNSKMSNTRTMQPTQGPRYHQGTGPSPTLNELLTQPSRYPQSQGYPNHTGPMEYPQGGGNPNEQSSHWENNQIRPNNQVSVHYTNKIVLFDI